MTSEPGDDQALLEQLADDLPEEELLGLCGRLADRLLREGWTAEAARWRDRLPCIKELRVLPGLGHCPHDEAPEQVNPILLEWIC
jgi:pimeloyl-ACP methyl ester carboxylesterase